MIPTTVTFYGDVGFDRSYANVIDFANETQRNTYFSTKVLKTVNNCAYNKPVNEIQLQCDYTDALKFTYCSFVIGSDNSNKKKIFAWVDDVAVVTEQPVENTYKQIISISISIDPWQTFLFDYTLGESFVAREHVDRFKANGDGTIGWTLSNTSDKSNVGLEKRTTSMANLKSSISAYEFGINGTGNIQFATQLSWLCIQYVDVVDVESWDDPTAMKLLFVPFADRNYCIKSSNSIGRTLQTTSVFNDAYLNLLKIDPEKVASVSYIPFDCYTSNGIVDIEDSEQHLFKCADITLAFSGFDIKVVTAGGTPWSEIDGMYLYFEKTYSPTDIIPVGKTFTKQITLSTTGLSVATNGAYSPTHEPQLYKQPYRYVSVIDECGVERGILPDIMANLSTQTYTLKLYLIIDSVEVRLRIVPVLPNSLEIDNTYWIEYPLTHVDVISHNWLSYLTQQRDTDRELIQSQINQNAIANAIGGVSGATSMGGSQAMGVGRAQASGSEAAMGLSEGGAFAAGGIVGLGVGAINTVGGYLASTYFCFEQQDIREKAIRRKANNVIISGSYRGAITGSLKICLMECDKTTFDIKAKEFHKYGYSVFLYETPDVKTRKYFNYIATTMVKIEGSLNNNIKMALAQIYNNGVTIWHGDYISELTGIGDYSKENIERSLMVVNNG